MARHSPSHKFLPLLAVSLLIVAGLFLPTAAAEDRPPQAKLPALLAKHTLRDTGERQKLVLIATDGRQIVVEIPIMAYIPDYEGVDFLQAVKEAKDEASTNPVTAKDSPDTPPTTTAKPATKDPATVLQELRGIMSAMSKIEQRSASPAAAGELRTLIFRLDAVTRELGASN